jgi:hypothetical protein
MTETSETVKQQIKEFDRVIELLHRAIARNDGRLRVLAKFRDGSIETHYTLEEVKAEIFTARGKLEGMSFALDALLDTTLQLRHGKEDNESIAIKSLTKEYADAKNRLKHFENALQGGWEWRSETPLKEEIVKATAEVAAFKRAIEIASKHG